MVMLLPVMLALAPMLGTARLGLRSCPSSWPWSCWPSRPSSWPRTRACARSTATSPRSPAAWAFASGRSCAVSSCRSRSPVIVGGFRIAILQVIATVTIGAYLAGGGLGRFIIDGIARRDDGMLYAGVLLVAGLAIGIDLLLVVAAAAAHTTRRAGSPEGEQPVTRPAMAETAEASPRCHLAGRVR